MKNSFLIIAIFLTLKAYSQYGADKEFSELKGVIVQENNLKAFEQKLKQFKYTFNDQFNTSVNVFLERDIDFGYTHTRIHASLEMNSYQIDLITRNDSIYLKSITTENFKTCCSYRWSNKELLDSYITKRNSFYNSSKNLENLFDEICFDYEYAMYCGEAYGLTEQGVKVKKYVLNKDFKSLKALLSNFSCEMQAFGVIGFSMMSEEKITIPSEYLNLIEHIKKRNSQLQVCAGCISGLVEKIY